jgi:hypothetical protein
MAVKVFKTEGGELMLRYVGRAKNADWPRFAGYPPNRLPKLSAKDDAKYSAAVQAGLKDLFDRQNAQEG